MSSLHDIAPRLAKARDQRLAELEAQRRFRTCAVASFERFRDACEALGRSSISLSDAQRRFAEAFELPIPKNARK